MSSTDTHSISTRSRAVLFIVFLAASFVSLVFAFVIRFGLQVPETYGAKWLWIGGLFVLLKIPSYILTFRFTHSLKVLNSMDVLRVLLFSAGSSLLILSVNVWYAQVYQFNLFPNSVWLIDFVAFTNFIILFQIIGWSVFNTFLRILKTNTYTSYKYLKSFIFAIKMLLFYERREQNNILAQLKRLEHI